MHSLTFVMFARGRLEFECVDFVFGRHILATDEEMLTSR